MEEAATADAELAVGTDVGGYVVERKIGEGGMGIVYGARHPRIGKRAAIKVLGAQYCRDPSTVERFEQEARFVNEIHHPNIVDIFMFGDLADGRKYIAMEWLEGESLSDRIERGPIPPREAAEILDGICDALEAAHEKGIIHRDLKSDNVFLVNARGRQLTKLLDFGLAKLSGNDPRAITKTKTGIVVGTPHYMSPEQVRGKQADARTDIYAVGVLAFKMLTQRLPFIGQPVELLVHHMKTPAPSADSVVPGLPPALCQLIMRMMEKEPERRPTLAEVRRVLADFKEGRATGAQPPINHSGALPAAGSGAAPQGLKGLHIALIAVGVIVMAIVSFVIVRALK